MCDVWVFCGSQKHTDDVDRVTLWLANVCRFLHNLKQYSGEEVRQTLMSVKVKVQNALQ